MRSSLVHTGCQRPRPTQYNTALSLGSIVSVDNNLKLGFELFAELYALVVPTSDAPCSTAPAHALPQCVRARCHL